MIDEIDVIDKIDEFDIIEEIDIIDEIDMIDDIDIIDEIDIHNRWIDIIDKIEFFDEIDGKDKMDNVTNEFDNDLKSTYVIDKFDKIDKDRQKMTINPSSKNCFRQHSEKFCFTKIKWPLVSGLSTFLEIFEFIAHGV